MIKYLGNEQYGIWSTILAIFSWIVLFDIGIGNGVRNRLAESLAKDNKEEGKSRKITIEELVELVAKRTTTKNDLTSAIMRVSKECPFPPKEKGNPPKSAKVYLNFILLVASHHNADAKIIAFMNSELKKSNPEYKKEIDIYENEGINQRGSRI